jgi:anti-sigma regulatory factor (Ser/Thr protein kinase)
MITYRYDLARVREFVRIQAGKAGLSGFRTGDLVIAVSELAANTLRHTRGGGSLHIWVEPGEVICEIADDGHITDPFVGRVRPAADAGHGHGLWVVRQLCDDVDIRSDSDGTTIQLRMRIFP